MNLTQGEKLVTVLLLTKYVKGMQILTKLYVGICESPIDPCRYVNNFRNVHIKKCLVQCTLFIT